MSEMEVVAYIAKEDVARLKDGESIVFYAQDRNAIGEPLVTFTSARAEIERLKGELGRLELSRGAASKVALDNIARAEAAKKERDSLLTAINQVGLDAEQKEWVANFLNRQQEPHNDA